MIDKNIVAFVNARKGSKGIPGKNKKKLLGKPLIEWTLDVIKNCKYISKVIVSTDDEDVFNICENYGCKPPFLRPSNLGGDNVLQIDVIKHSVNYLKSINYNFENIILLQPTCPIRIVNDLNMSIEKYCHNNYDSLISVTDVGGRHPKTCYSSIDNKLNPNAPPKLTPATPEDIASRKELDQSIKFRTDDIKPEDLVRKTNTLEELRNNNDVGSISKYRLVANDHLFITKHVDEWYLISVDVYNGVTILNSPTFNYKCDTFEGVKNLFSDIIS